MMMYNADQTPLDVAEGRKYRDGTLPVNTDSEYRRDCRGRIFSQREKPGRFAPGKVTGPDLRARTTAALPSTTPHLSQCLPPTRQAPAHV